LDQACDNALPFIAEAPMTEAPPFDPPYFSVEKSEQGVRIIETRVDGSRQELAASAGSAAWLPADASSMSSTPAPTRPKNSSRPSSGMPPGSILLAVPFAEKDAAKKLGARWNAERRSWYVPPGTNVSPFERWRKDES
jgi:hypothetical protein